MAIIIFLIVSFLLNFLWYRFTSYISISDESTEYNSPKYIFYGVISFNLILIVSIISNISEYIKIYRFAKKCNYKPGDEVYFYKHGEVRKSTISSIGIRYDNNELYYCYYLPTLTQTRIVSTVYLDAKSHVEFEEKVNVLENRKNNIKEWLS
jgi:hypothetical protein